MRAFSAALELRRVAGVLVFFIALALAGCGGGSSGGSNDSRAGLTGGGGAANNQFDIATAVLTIVGPTRVAPNGVINLIARLLDANGNAPPSPGLFISLTPSPQRGTIAANGVPNNGGDETNAQGEVPFTYTADNLEQRITITAQASQNGITKTDTHVIQVDDGFDFASATVTITGPDVVSTGSTRNYTVTILDNNNQPPVTPLNVDIAPTSGGGITNPNNANTDSSGQVPFTYQAPNNPTTATLTATAREGAATKTGNKQVQVRSDTFVFTQPANNATVTSGFPSRMQFDWRVAGSPVTTGQPLPNGGGTASQVTLNVTGGGGGGGFSVSGDTPQTTRSVDISNGNFNFPVDLVSGTAGGPATVNATANGGFSTTLNVTFVGEPTNISVQPQNPSISAGSSQPFTVTLTDGGGRPVGGPFINFEITDCAPGGAPPCPAPERFQPASARTNSNGQVTSSYFAGNTGTASLRFVEPNSGVSTITNITVTP